MPSRVPLPGGTFLPPPPAAMRAAPSASPAHIAAAAGSLLPRRAAATCQRLPPPPPAVPGSPARPGAGPAAPGTLGPAGLRGAGAAPANRGVLLIPSPLLTSPPARQGKRGRVRVCPPAPVPGHGIAPCSRSSRGLPAESFCFLRIRSEYHIRFRR